MNQWYLPAFGEYLCMFQPSVSILLCDRHALLSEKMWFVMHHWLHCLMIWVLVYIIAIFKSSSHFVLGLHHSEVCLSLFTPFFEICFMLLLLEFWIAFFIMFNNHHNCCLWRCTSEISAPSCVVILVDKVSFVVQWQLNLLLPSCERLLYLVDKSSEKIEHQWAFLLLSYRVT